MQIKNAPNRILDRAVICANGQLTEPHKNLSALLPSALGSAQRKEKKKVLLLGSGFVAAPVVDYLLRFSDVHVTVGIFIANCKAAMYIQQHSNSLKEEKIPWQ